MAIASYIEWYIGLQPVIVDKFSQVDTCDPIHRHSEDVRWLPVGLNETGPCIDTTDATVYQSRNVCIIISLRMTDQVRAREHLPRARASIPAKSVDFQ